MPLSNAKSLLENRASNPPAMTAMTTLFDLEKQHILQVYESLEHNVTKTADALAIDRRTLQRKLKSYGIVRDVDEA